MLELDSEASFILEIKKSKFIAYLVSYNNFKKTQEKLKREHPKARHIVYAYRYLNEFNQIVENLSDDGEPKGSSGPPSLAVLRGKELVNCAVLIVRYFGGTRLGIGGLVRAYGQSVNEVINLAKFVEYKKRERKTYSIAFSNLAKFEHSLKNLDQTHLSFTKDFTATSCDFTIDAPEEILKIIEALT